MSTVLLVDDEHDIRVVARLQLESDGHSVLEAADGEQALAIVDEGRPDVMLLDLEMPHTNGLSVLERLRSKGRPYLPVVIFSANVHLLSQGIAELGCQGCVVKPYRLRDLLTAVENAAAA